MIVHVMQEDVGSLLWFTGLFLTVPSSQFRGLKPLTWAERVSILVDAACGLGYPIIYGNAHARAVRVDGKSGREIAKILRVAQKRL